MFDILFARTFIIVGCMLLITTITSRINKTYESKFEMWATIIATFVFLFAVMIFADLYPLNLVLVAIFSGLIGWEIGPTIESIGVNYQLSRFLKSKGIVLEKDKELTPEQAQYVQDFANNFAISEYSTKWRNVVFKALSGTVLSVFATAGVVFLTGIDFGFLGTFLFISLLILIVMGLLNAFWFKSTFLSLLSSYAGVVIFVLYLLYDFNQLEKMAGDKTWGTAVSIAVNLYLDIINLFLSLLQILGHSDK